jgi:hypothetical protein
MTTSKNQDKRGLKKAAIDEVHYFLTTCPHCNNEIECQQCFEDQVLECLECNGRFVGEV